MASITITISAQCIFLSPLLSFLTVKNGSRGFFLNRLSLFFSRYLFYSSKMRFYLFLVVVVDLVLNTIRVHLKKNAVQVIENENVTMELLHPFF